MTAEKKAGVEEKAEIEAEEKIRVGAEKTAREMADILMGVSLSVIRAPQILRQV